MAGGIRDYGHVRRESRSADLYAATNEIVTAVHTSIAISETGWSGAP
jgi:hypothetical protein